MNRPNNQLRLRRTKIITIVIVMVAIVMLSATTIKQQPASNPVSHGRVNL